MIFASLFFGACFGFYIRGFLESKPVILTCIHCGKQYEQNPFSGCFCSKPCSIEHIAEFLK